MVGGVLEVNPTKYSPIFIVIEVISKLMRPVIEFKNYLYFTALRDAASSNHVLWNSRPVINLFFHVIYSVIFTM